MNTTRWLGGRRKGGDRTDAAARNLAAGSAILVSTRLTAERLYLYPMASRRVVQRRLAVEAS
jgi:hypothetical protein